MDDLGLDVDAVLGSVPSISDGRLGYSLARKPLIRKGHRIALHGIPDNGGPAHLRVGTTPLVRRLAVAPAGPMAWFVHFRWK